MTTTLMGFIGGDVSIVSKQGVKPPKNTFANFKKSTPNSQYMFFRKKVVSKKVNPSNIYSTEPARLKIGFIDKILKKKSLKRRKVQIYP
jgi:hypothetical protein